MKTTLKDTLKINYFPLSALQLYYHRFLTFFNVWVARKIFLYSECLSEEIVDDKEVTVQCPWSKSTTNSIFNDFFPTKNMKLYSIKTHKTKSSNPRPASGNASSATNVAWPSLCRLQLSESVRVSPVRIYQLYFPETGVQAGLTNTFLNLVDQKSSPGMRSGKMATAR